MLPVILASVLCVATWLAFRDLRRSAARAVLNNLPGPPSISFWTGNLRQFYDRRGWVFQRDISQNYGPVVRLNGLLNRPMLYVIDPKALHSIVIKDQHDYEETRARISSNLLSFGPSILSTVGDHHRRQRKFLNPVFSISHMRYMLPIFYRVIEQLRCAVQAQVRDGPQEVDVLNWMGRTALELIGQAGLGYSFDPLVKDTPDEYGDALKAYIPTMFSLSIFRMFAPYVESLGPPAFRRRVLELLPHVGLQRITRIVDTMTNRSKEIFNEKKHALDAGDEAVLRQVGEGKDLMSLLMKANAKASSGERLPEAELIAQMTSLIFAAMDTTSNSLSRILDMLSQHPDVQQKLREEIVGARHGHDLGYDELMDLPYLDAVCRETLRLHPPALIILREACKDMVLPLSQPIHGRDGKLIPEILVPKHTQLVIGILGSNCNKALWGEDALEWKPERWLSPLPDALVQAHIPGVYSNLMTFMGGGTSCIGFKFSELEMKAVLCSLLPCFSFELPNEPITWNFANVNYPTMGDSIRPGMRLKVTALKG